MGTTPKTKNGNNAQKVLKSIEPSEGISLNITKKATTKELNCLLTGISGFIGNMSAGKYNVNIQVSKIMEEVKENDQESDNTTD